MMKKSDLAKTEKTNALRLAALTSVCVIALASATALPVTLDNHGLALKHAHADSGNGNGNGNGKDNAPGQQKQVTGGQDADGEDAVDSISAGVAAESGESEQLAIVPIAEDAEPASNKVIKELAGLPEESALSEEEELEAIRSGWGTWRTADGPETVIAQ